VLGQLFSRKKLHQEYLQNVHHSNNHNRIFASRLLINMTHSRVVIFIGYSYIGIRYLVAARLLQWGSEQGTPLTVFRISVDINPVMRCIIHACYKVKWRRGLSTSILNKQSYCLFGGGFFKVFFFSV